MKMVKVIPFRRQAGRGRRVRRVLASKVDRRLPGDDGSARGAAAASYNSDEEDEKEKEKGRGFRVGTLFFIMEARCVTKV
jgi:hypothetical protein